MSRQSPRFYCDSSSSAEPRAAPRRFLSVLLCVFSAQGLFSTVFAEVHSPGSPVFALDCTRALCNSPTCCLLCDDLGHVAVRHGHGHMCQKLGPSDSLFSSCLIVFCFSFRHPPEVNLEVTAGEEDLRKSVRARPVQAVS